MHSLNDTVLERNNYIKINFNEGGLSSQQRFPVFYRISDSILRQIYDIMRKLRKIVYVIKKPQMLLLDLDSILLATYGHQEGKAFNVHYQNHGYHSLVWYDGMKVALQYCIFISSVRQMDFKVSYTVEYDEFMYLAGSWNYPRRVVCKIKKLVGQLVYMFTFIVTNMDFSPKELICFSVKEELWKLYQRGKNGFDIVAVSSPFKVVNASHVQFHALAYNILDWFK